MSFRFRRGKKDEDVIVDRVTGAFNRRQLDEDIANGIDTSDRPTATLMIEVDHLNAYTGKKGVSSAEQVLERVAWVIMATVRTTDVVYRHSEDSFCVLLPATSDADAVAVADRIQSNVAKMPLLSESGVSITVGVASGPSATVGDAVERALQALGEAVRTGQPRVLDPGLELVKPSATLAPPGGEAPPIPAGPTDDITTPLRPAVSQPAPPAPAPPTPTPVAQAPVAQAPVAPAPVAPAPITAVPPPAPAPQLTSPPPASSTPPAASLPEPGLTPPPVPPAVSPPAVSPPPAFPPPPAT